MGVVLCRGHHQHEVGLEGIVESLAGNENAACCLEGRAQIDQGGPNRVATAEWWGGVPTIGRFA